MYKKNMFCPSCRGRIEDDGCEPCIDNSKRIDNLGDEMKIEDTIKSIKKHTDNFKYVVEVTNRYIPNWFERLVLGMEIKEVTRSYLGYCDWYNIPNMNRANSSMVEVLDQARRRFEYEQEISKR